MRGKERIPSIQKMNIIFIIYSFLIVTLYNLPSWMYLKNLVMFLTCKATTFYSYYCEPHISTKVRDPPRNDEGDQPKVPESGLSICNEQGKAYGKTTTRYLDVKKYKAAMSYILLICNEEVHNRITDVFASLAESDVQTRISKEFPMWFREEMLKPMNASNNKCLKGRCSGRPSQEVVLSKCDWLDSHLNRGLKIHDNYKLTSRIDIVVQDTGTLIHESGKLESVVIRRRNKIMDEDENDEDEEEVEQESLSVSFLLIYVYMVRGTEKKRAHPETSTPLAVASIPVGILASPAMMSIPPATLTPSPQLPYSSLAPISTPFSLSSVVGTL
ncbi:hypothetical protein M9H77_18396 [Catharanthus roseus]|uniref:Uncharacterized protein n=1 Tax=Catharanthus roseus TaxID=4058 RepID=A0ACC0B7N5_CATRO|nr:hypothetical protein M9H77_18396 [Catharanthus roseus]